MRQAGRFMRDVQNTSQSFIAEMERAADTAEPPRPLRPAEPRSGRAPLPPEFKGDARDGQA